VCFGVTSFFVGGLRYEPLAFWGCLFFSSEVFVWAPFVLGLPLFSSEVFVLSPLCFGVASFFIGGLCFEPTIEGCDNALLVLALAYLA
jgi:hypothetical protein